MSDPVGIDVGCPRFSWEIVSDARGLVQVSYRITVDRIGPEGESSTDWDSGTVLSANPFTDPGPMPPLRAASQYRWSLDVVTSMGSAAATAVFTTGLFGEADWMDSKWIGGPARSEGVCPAPLLRRRFDVEPGATIHSATLFVAAGGYANVLLNGVPVTDAVLAPGFTDYDHTVEYVAYDVRGAIRSNGNAIGIELGRGFYGMRNPNVWDWHTAPWNAEPVARVLLVITYGDGRVDRVVSDETWKWTPGPTLRDDVYGGETYDARRAVPEFAHPECLDGEWARVALRDGPKGALVRQSCQPSRVVEELRPHRITRSRSGSWIVEFPRVVAGWVSLSVSGSEGETVTVAYGERLDSDGGVDLRNNGRFGDGFQTDRFVLAGTGDRETWAPSFSYKGFQFVQIDGWPSGTSLDEDAVIAQVVHTDVETTGRFASSSTLMNRIHGIARDTMLNNLQGLPTDTPMFEKNGWTGDGMLGAEMFLMNFDCAALFAKWTDDIAATRSDGGAPKVIAPSSDSWGDWGPAPTWHSAYVLVPDWLARYAGDSRALERHYEGMCEYVRFELARSPGGIATSSLGDWVSPETDPRGENPPDDRRVPATAFLYVMSKSMNAIAERLGRPSDGRFFADAAAAVREAFIGTFYDEREGIVRGEGDEGFRQTHNVLALAFGLVPSGAEQRVADAIARDVRQRGMTLNTGALGTKYLLPVLTEHGHVDVAVALAEQTRFPSWGYWLDNGATSLWEHWKIESRSRGHYFLGTVDDWFYHYVAGIRPASEGFRTFRVDPRATEQLSSAGAQLRTPFGVAAVEWWRDGDAEFSLRLRVPVGTTALVRIPATASSVVSEGGVPISGVAGVAAVQWSDGVAAFEAGAGEYLFTVDSE
ncbi:alpha-L-rhamnosidase [Agromyces marinus]|uniref:alpha-L-rhamnosidase n=1 Tax=Agromyces marinus TaxID=1389020 RepID=UPI001F2D3F5B|nr:alpha-L-rhamnosidase [Agromyces marinus]